MYNLKSFAFYVITCLLLLPHAIKTQNTKVVPLNKDNYVVELKSHKFFVILFSSKQKDPEYKTEMNVFNALINLVNKQTKADPSSPLSKVSFGKSGIEDSHYIALRFKIADIPSIVLNFRDENRYVYYKGSFKANNIYYWLQKHIISSLNPLNSVNDIEQYIKFGKDIPTMIYFTNFKNHSEDEMKLVEKPTGFSIYTNQVLNEDNIRFGFSFVNEEIIKKYNLENKLSNEMDTLIAFNHLDNSKEEFTFKRDDEKEFSTEKLMKFILSVAFPTLIDYDIISRKILLDYHKPGLILFAKKDDPQLKQYKQIVTNVAKDYHYDIQAMYASRDTYQEEVVCNVMGIKETMFPCIRIIEARRTNTIYRLDNDITESNLKTFLEQWINGDLKKKIKSERPSPDDEKGPIIRLVGETLNSLMISRNEYDRLVLFSSEDCPWCKYLNPIFEGIAKKYVGFANPLFKMYKIDINKNYIGDIKIKKTPCIKLWKAHNQNENPIDLEYDGEINDEILNLFVLAKTKYELTENQPEQKSEEL
jgi:thiol-disulfide isomerase/thioredoxin